MRDLSSQPATRLASTASSLTAGASIPPFPPAIDLSDLDGSNGFALNGVSRVEQSGLSVSGAGDVNGDGFDDLIIGAFAADPVFSGQSYVVFGAADGFPASLDLGTLDGGNGFALNGVSSDDLSGRSVSGAGDVNGDGFDDLIIGAPIADPSAYQSGQSYVVFGAADEFPAALDLGSLDGSNGFALNGVSSVDRSGYSVSGAGDVNGDGFDDVIIGAPLAGPGGLSDSGQSYVVFGAADGFPAALELGVLDGSNGFALNGVSSYDLSGESVSGAGDVNGDGFDDLIIGARLADPGGYSSGQSYVVFGAADEFAASLDLGTLDGSNGFALNGVSSFDRSYSVSGAGDVNGDGFDDLIIGAFGADPGGDYSGQSYVVFGAAHGFPASLDLGTLDGSNGFALNGVSSNDVSGISVGGAGDVNGDGFDDLIIGAPSAEGGEIFSGQSYVVFGAADGFPAALDLGTLDGSNGFALNGVSNFDSSGRSVSGAGDVNGDGFDDLIIGAPGADPGAYASGQSYVVFGGPRPGPSITGTDGNDRLVGTDLGELITGLDGRDRILGEGGRDRISGDAGADRINGGDGDDIIDGGLDRDILFGGAGADTFVLANGDTFDLIQDFQVGVDNVQLDLDGVTPDDLRVVDRGSSALLQADLGSGFVTLANIAGAAGVSLEQLIQLELPEDTSILDDPLQL